MATGNLTNGPEEIQPICSKRHSLQAVELSQRIQTAVQIVSKPPASSKGGGGDLPFLGQAGHADPASLLALLLMKAG